MKKKVIDIYRSIYDQGIEPKIFLNDFLEFYITLKIFHLKVEGTNFNLNDTEFNSIKKLSNSINNETLILFWQFTIKTLGEMDIVSNQHLAMEMFLIRLIHLKEIKNLKNLEDKIDNLNEKI